MNANNLDEVNKLSAKSNNRVLAHVVYLADLNGFGLRPGLDASDIVPICINIAAELVGELPENTTDEDLAIKTLSIIGEKVFY